jgi:hypothetical protein
VSEAKQSTTESRDTQTQARESLRRETTITSGERKAKMTLTVSIKTRYYRYGSSPWFREIKMHIRAFLSTNRARAGHSSLKASLSRFTIVFTAECERGDGLQTEEHIFWVCALYEDQRARMMDILSENTRKEYRNSVTELLRVEEKRFV